MQEVCLFSGRSNPALAEEIATQNQLYLGNATIKEFADGEISVCIEDDVQGKDCVILQSLAISPNDYLIELLMIADALKRARAKSIAAIVPYLAYSRQDRINRAAVPITARLVANLIEKAGVQTLITLDMHTEQLEGFFDIPLIHLQARDLLIEAITVFSGVEPLVVAPDLGSVRYAQEISYALDTDFGVINKKRTEGHKVSCSQITGDIKGKNVLLVDDVVSTGETLCQAAEACHKLGASSVHAMVTHGIFAGSAIEKIERSPIKKLIVSNSIAQDPQSESSKIEVISIADLFHSPIQSLKDQQSARSLCVG